MLERIPIPRARSWLVALTLIAAACGSEHFDEHAAAVGVKSAKRNIDELQRLERFPRVCVSTADCPTGSYCDDDTAICRWDCLADDHCGGGGKVCTPDGACAAALNAVGGGGISVNVADDTPACQAQDPATKRIILLGGGPDNLEPLRSRHEACDPEDERCPCGSYCSARMDCWLDCVPVNPPPGYTCLSNEVCNPKGECVPGAGQPPEPEPQVEIAIDLSTELVEADSTAGAVVVPLDVTIVVASSDLTASQHPADVRVGYQELRAFSQGHLEDEPDPKPQVRCTSSGAFGNECTLAGPWTFPGGTGLIRSNPRTVWIQIPQSAIRLEWLFEATSRWAPDPTTAVVRSLPPRFPSASPGTYTGEATIQTRSVSAAAFTDKPSTLPINAYVTANHVALYEPSRILFPDGRLVLPRIGSNIAMKLAWLTTDIAGQTTSIDTLVRWRSDSYSQATGKLTLGLELSIDADQWIQIEAVLDWQSALALATCSTASQCSSSPGTYCDVGMGRCVPGSGQIPATAVAATTPVVAQQLGSKLMSTWSTPVNNVRAQLPDFLGGTGYTGIERAYCFDPTITSGAPRYAVIPPDQATMAVNSVSLEAECLRPGAGGTPFTQQTFKYLIKDREQLPPPAGSTVPSFDLFEKCMQELALEPTGSTASTLLASRDCASVGRFVLAMTANSGQPSTLYGQRLVNQILRQWLGLHAYVARTAVKDTAYDAVAAVISDTHVRLGESVERVESGLRVMLDPQVSPQYGTGNDLVAALTAPDLRVISRPKHRWTFNAGTGAASEGGIAMSVSNAAVSVGRLHSNNRLGVCVTPSSIAMPSRRHSMVVNAGFNSFRRDLDPVTILGNTGGIRLRGTTCNSAGSEPCLNVSATDGTRTINFTPALSLNGQATWGLLTYTVDNGKPRLYQAQVGQDLKVFSPTTEPAESAIPVWTTGTAYTGCFYSQASSCSSWHRYVNGDFRGVATRNRTIKGTDRDWSCHTTGNGNHSCSGTPPGSGRQNICNGEANTVRNGLVSGLTAAGVPSSFINAMTVVGQPAGEPLPDDEENFSVTWWCNSVVTMEPIQDTGSKPICGGPIAGEAFTELGVFYDEVSLWDRPLAVEEIRAMGLRYASDFTKESVPPPPPVLEGKEQTMPVPVYMLEAASAQLELIERYVEAESDAMYEECYQGAPAVDGLNRTLARAGRNLRLARLIEAEAARLAKLVTSPTWLDRYQKALLQLQGRRLRVVDSIKGASTCKNSLRISERVLPMYNGQAVGANAKFFASSQYLVAEAERELSTFVEPLLSSARNAFIATRQNAYQLNADREARSTREGKIRADYESILRGYCGTPPGTQKLLTGFLNETLNVGNCFIRTDVAGCSDAGTKKIGEVKAECMRGKLGELVLAMQTASAESDKAMRDYDGLVEKKDGDGRLCARRRDIHFAVTSGQVLHDEHMEEARDTQIWLKALAVPLSILGADKSVSGIGGPIGAFASLIATGPEGAAAREDAAWRREVASYESWIGVAECFHSVQNQVYGLRSARDGVVLAMKKYEGAVFSLASAKDQIAGIVIEANGQLGLEASLDATPPHLHYWLDETIADYGRHFAYAKRLTYLAVRALEYEAQDTIRQRGKVLTATHPSKLREAISAIKAVNAPLVGGIPLATGDIPIMLSVRDEILRLENAPPGQAPETPQQVFRRYLTSDAAKVFSKGVFLGRGIRFTLRPAGFSAGLCAERIWRMYASIITDGAPSQPRIDLLQRNTFGSQLCTGDPGLVTYAVTDPQANVLRGDDSSFAASDTYLPVTVVPLVGASKEVLGQQPETNGASGFAGRGIFADYIILFAKERWSDSDVAQMSDVLLRFDISEATHVPQPDH